MKSPLLGKPFLTVVMRTQGNRIATMREALLCLSTQTSQDFEVCIVGHDLDADRQRAVERVIADFHVELRDRVRLVRATGGTRATPLNVGFADARGHYIAAFDDDDLLLEHWVETFEHLARRAPGQVLRQVAVGQDWELTPSATGGTASHAVGGMKPLYATHFDLFDHFIENRTPLHCVAFPRTLFHERGERFDETLTTFEDWDYLLRVALLVGVTASPSVGCIYRHWRNLETSVVVHDDAEWHANCGHVVRKLDQVPVLFPAGSVQRLRDMASELERLRLAEKAKADQIAKMERSRTWRVATFLRRLSGRSARRPA
ncbi:glycosyltransferase family 2 protein [Noviluteimonas gilva]|uniref:Glycosyltransferase n=1 Tax=Noviluteimonas gilva TaxID=2682097 RepID=A0A7C9HNW8_9GAMM|nr:glycosyltransferase family A protein [Lysobacter gilvus]MUV15695.1 glycosyltransferase [Lysobacter gilvus]